MPEIRPIEANELPDCLHVIRTSFGTVADMLQLTKERCPRHPAYMNLSLLEKRLAEGWQMFGLFENHTLIGYFSMSKGEDGAAALHNLSILPDCRESGYGRMLLEFCAAKAKAAGYEKITLEIIEENRPLKAWYLRQGYRHLKTLSLPACPFTIGFMEKDL